MLHYESIMFGIIMFTLGPLLGVLFYYDKRKFAEEGVAAANFLTSLYKYNSDPGTLLKIRLFKDDCLKEAEDYTFMFWWWVGMFTLGMLWGMHH
jgi:hypothetical protein